MEHQAQLRIATSQYRIDLLVDVLFLWCPMEFGRTLLDLLLWHAFLEEDERGVQTAFHHLRKLRNCLRVIDDLSYISVWPAHHQVIGYVVALPIQIHYHFSIRQNEQSGVLVAYWNSQLSALTFVTQWLGFLSLMPSFQTSDARWADQVFSPCVLGPVWSNLRSFGLRSWRTGAWTHSYPSCRLKSCHRCFLNGWTQYR